MELIYNHFKSPLEQKLMRRHPPAHRQEELVTDHEPRASWSPTSSSRTPKAIFKGLLPAYVEIAIYRALLESSASEQGARMTAMRNASDSAEDMIETLRWRSTAPARRPSRKEILEVVAGADALGVTGRRAGVRRSDRGRVTTSRSGTHGQGTVDQVIGAVIDVRFPDELPAIYNALRVTIDSGDGDARELVVEVQQHLGDNRVRAVAMDTTDGLARGVEVIDTGEPMTMPVGEKTLGRLINVLGDTIDNGEPSSPTSSTGPSIGRRPASSRSIPRTRSSRPASRSSTCSRPT